MQQAYLSKIKEGAIQSWLKHKVLPSVTGAQAILESGWGQSTLARPPYNNNFGIKAEAGWTGRKVLMPTREVINGVSVMVNDYFRAYDSIADSVADHGAFFTSSEWRRNNYKAVIGEKNYRTASWALQNAGYATDPNYANALIRIIEQNSLQTWDEEAFRREANRSSNTSSGGSETVPNKGSGNAGSDNPESTHEDREYRRELAKKATAPVSKRVGRAMTNAGEDHFKSVRVAFYGDSSLNKADQELRKLGSGVSTYRFSTLDNLSNLISSHVSSNSIPDTVIIAGGATGKFTETKIEEIIKKLGNKRNVILVTMASELPNRNVIEIITKDLSNRLSNVYVADWLGYSRQRLPQFYDMEKDTRLYVKLSDYGSRKYAEFLAQAVYQVDLGTEFSGKYEPVVLEDEREGIEEFELKPDGRAIHHTFDNNGRAITMTHSTGLKGFVSPLGDSAIYATDSNAIWGNNDGVVLSEWIDGVYEADLSGLDLLISAGKELEKRSQISAQYRVNLLELPNDIKIGDVGQFIDHEFNPPLYIEARVISLRYDVFDHSVNEVVLGNVKELVPDYNPEVVRLQNQLKSVRQEVLKDFKKGLPLEVSIESTNGIIFYEDMEQTQLIAKVRQSGRDVTDQYVKYRWERMFTKNNDSTKNKDFNEMLSLTETSSVLNVHRSDLGIDENGSAIFVVYVYDERNRLIDTASVAVGVAKGEKGDRGEDGHDFEWNLFSMPKAWETENTGTAENLTYEILNAPADKEYVVQGFLKEGKTPIPNFNVVFSHGTPDPDVAQQAGGASFHVIKDGQPYGTKYIPTKMMKEEPSYMPAYISFYPSTTDMKRIKDTYQITILESKGRNGLETFLPHPDDLKGEKGDKGAQGDRGAQGAKGDKGEAGDVTRNYFIAHNLDETSEKITIDSKEFKQILVPVEKGKRYNIVGTMDKDKEEAYVLNLKNKLYEGQRWNYTPPNDYITIIYDPKIEDKIMAMESDYRIHIYKYSTTPQPWEPSIEDSIFLSTKDMRSEIANKASAGMTQAQLNELKAQAEAILQEQRALASKRELNDFMRAFNSFLDAQEKDKVDAEKNLTSALGRVAEIENELGEMAVSWKFLTKEITASEEGLLIGNKSKGTYLLQSDDRISFFNNGSEVAFISGGMLRITRAVFLREIVIGSFSISEYEDDHLTFRYVGRR